mgnify:CR=1 FL=1
MIDYDFDKIFSRPFQALAKKNDVLIAISTSGNSKNIIEVLKEAKKRKFYTRPANMRQRRLSALHREAKKEEFIQQTESLIEALVKRINRENTDLYVLVDKL